MSQAVAPLVRARGEDLTKRAVLRGEETTTLWSRRHGWRLSAIKVLSESQQRRLRRLWFLEPSPETES